MARSVIDLSRLPPPDAVKPLHFEALWDEIVADVVREVPEAAPAMGLKSEMMVRVGRRFAFRLLLEVNARNQAVRSVMPALSRGADLRHLGVIVGIDPLVIDPGDPAQGIPPTYEDDDAFLRRFVMAGEGYSVAGPAGAYEFHALSADGAVKDASATSPSPGHVVVSVLSHDGDGTASAELVQTVEAAVSADTVRPLTDYVTVQSATVKTYAIRAKAWTFAGPDAAVVVQKSQKEGRTFADENHLLSRDINLSSLYAALTVAGVQRIELLEPLANIVCGPTEAAFCTAVVIEHGGLDE
ncbi:baseplate J/gp47 family protein [Brevundimonas faecalis]|uniref:baseplate assembly protein n=1 Tax=Brevundimonas faecalis TaxID=947378 RepID=UPI003616C32F